MSMSTSGKRSSASCVRPRLCWRGAGQYQMPAGSRDTACGGFQHEPPLTSTMLTVLNWSGATAAEPASGLANAAFHR